MMWEHVRNIGISVLSFYALFKFGPPVVDICFLPTIEYVAGTFNAIAPQPPPATTFMHMQTPTPAGNTAIVPKTAFVEQAGYETKLMNEGVTITGINQGEWPFTAYHSHSDSSSGPFHNFRFSFDWFPRVIYETTHAILLHLRQLVDNFLYQVQLFTAIVISWKLLKYRSQMNMKHVTALNEAEIVEMQQEFSALAVAKDLENASLDAQNGVLKHQLEAQRSLLDQARQELEDKASAEEQSKSDLAKLKSRLTDRDNEMADRDNDLAEASRRAETAENLNKTLENKAKKSRSDFDSALQKKENEINMHKRTSQQATKDGDTAYRELKDARAQAGQDRKRLRELERQLTDSTKQIAELKAQVKAKDASIGQKDTGLTRMREERQKLVKDVENMAAERDRALKNGRDATAKDKKTIGELHVQLAEAKTSCKIAEERATKEKVNAAEAAAQLVAKDNKIASLKADAKSSSLYRQSRLDAAGTLNEELHTTLKTERAEAQQAATQARKTEEALHERIAELQERLQQNPVSSDIAATSSDASSQELSGLRRPKAIVRLPSARPTNTTSRPGPRVKPPAHGVTKTPPEERGLPKDTPTGPKAGR